MATRLTGGDTMKGVKPVEPLVKKVMLNTNIAITGASHCHGMGPTPGPVVPEPCCADPNWGCGSENKRDLRLAEGRRGIQERNWFSS